MTKKRKYVSETCVRSSGNRTKIDVACCLLCINREGVYAQAEHLTGTPNIMENFWKGTTRNKKLSSGAGLNLEFEIQFVTKFQKQENLWVVLIKRALIVTRMKVNTKKSKRHTQPLKISLFIFNAQFIK